MRVCVIAGGVGSARFLAGLVRVVDPSEVTVIGNTGDDERVRGLHVSPDIDTVLYHLAGETDWERGWGLADETFVANERYVSLVERSRATPQRSGGADDDVDMQEWFGLGDRDLATNMFRTRLLDAGRTLSDAIDSLRRAMGIASAVLPMSDDPVRTELVTSAGERLDFQTYFVRRQHADAIASVDFAGADEARAALGVIDAITGAEVLIIPPSNPIVTVAPVLAVPGIRDAIASSGATRVAVSPIVGGRAIKGPLEALLRSFGHDVSPSGVAAIYGGLVDVFVLDEQDAGQAPGVEALGMRAVVCDTIMSGPDEAARLARDVLARVSGGGPR
jgi:LPPG:FO 2-phospho-L-lactate transferase